jgi:uncharacterized membrane protein YgcG
MDRISPQAYCYLRHPILSSGETMLQYTIQHLCFSKVLGIDRRLVRAHPKDRAMSKRILLKRLEPYAPSTKAEHYALGLFPLHRPITIGDLRAIVRHELPDLERFKYDHMFPDLLEAGMLSSKFVRTSSGRDAMQAVRSVRKLVDRRIDHFLARDRDGLIHHLNALGSNVVLLKKETRSKLHGLMKEVPELALTLSSGATFDTMGGFDSFAAFDSLSLGDSFDSGGDFGGFGGGDFDGGGAGGDW